ncbi:hypothetical protein LSTR_LSTR008323 [Laodelphax striatellus]|uniref:Uncharacterized protein n=1 Tax=Laodelphax striatellus TaxID=195883 RepID=A0A482XJ57_LAOST|nr:hypothetical protein LSTR_LSTR008323 [Laodelphax striatellus]
MRSAWWVWEEEGDLATKTKSRSIRHFLFNAIPSFLFQVYRVTHVQVYKIKSFFLLLFNFISSVINPPIEANNLPLVEAYEEVQENETLALKKKLFGAVGTDGLTSPPKDGSGRICHKILPSTRLEPWANGFYLTADNLSV